MRIAEVAEFYSPTGGGVKSYIDRKFEAASAAGHELFVIAPAAEDGFEARAGGGVVWVRCAQLPFDANYRMFWDAEPVHRRLDDIAPDLVEASSPWRGAWIAAGWRSSAPRALFVHADPVASYPHRWLSPLMSPARVDRLFGRFWAYLRRLAGRFDGVVVGGGWLAERLAAQGIGRIASVPLGVDRGVFSPARRDAGLRAELLEACGQPESARLLLGVGRFHPEKRWPMVIAAASAAGTDHPMGLVVVGDGLDRARVASAAAGRPHVHLMPPIRDRARLAAVLASADVLVHGCESETFGLVPAEAMASGVPLVAPDRGGCSHMARPETSETYRAGDGAAAAQAIRRLLARDPVQLRAAAVVAARDVRSDVEHYGRLFDHYQGLACAKQPT
jgi:alpha-1,6-mannosyltransferase